MTIKAATLSAAALAVASTPGTTRSFAFNPSACRTPRTSFLMHSEFTSLVSERPWVSRGGRGMCDVIAPLTERDNNSLFRLWLESGATANANAPHPALKMSEGDVKSESVQGKTTAKKVMKAVGLALAWYLASSAAALAISSVTGLSHQPRSGRRMPIAPTLLVLYIISGKKIKTRNRFAGVVPEDDRSRQQLADDAFEMAVSWGKPAGRIALLAVDAFSFLAIFRFSGYDFSKLLVGRGMEQLMSLKFWIPYGAAATIGATGVTAIIRRFGHGYLRSTVATLLAPIIRTVIITPAQTVASLFGGGDWDLGISDEERAAKRASSRRLRESLSTFQDVNFAEEDNGDGSESGAPPSEPGANDGDDEDGGEEGEEGGQDGGAPPSLKRTT